MPPQTVFTWGWQVVSLSEERRHRRAPVRQDFWCAGDTSQSRSLSHSVDPEREPGTIYFYKDAVCFSCARNRCPFMHAQTGVILQLYPNDRQCTINIFWLRSFHLSIYSSHCAEVSRLCVFVPDVLSCALTDHIRFMNVIWVLLLKISSVLLQKAIWIWLRQIHEPNKSEVNIRWKYYITYTYIYI